MDLLAPGLANEGNHCDPKEFDHDTSSVAQKGAIARAQWGLYPVCVCVCECECECVCVCVCVSGWRDQKQGRFLFGSPLNQPKTLCPCKKPIHKYIAIEFGII